MGDFQPHDDYFDALQHARPASAGAGAVGAPPSLDETPSAVVRSFASRELQDCGKKLDWLWLTQGAVGFVRVSRPRTLKFSALFDQGDADATAALGGGGGDASVASDGGDASSSAQAEALASLERLKITKAQVFATSEIEVEREVGAGAYSTVFECTAATKSFSGRVAVKVLKLKACLDPRIAPNRRVAEARVRVLRAMVSEIQVLEHLTNRLWGSKYVVRSHGIMLRPLAVVTEFMSGSLLEQLRATPPPPPLQRLQWAAHAAQGVVHMHEKSYAHGDLAARNILVSDDDCAKIADLGFAHEVEFEWHASGEGGGGGGGGASASCSAEEGRLAWRYAAPELAFSALTTLSSDVYSLGCVLYEIFSGGREPALEPEPGVEATTPARHFERLAAGERPLLDGVLPLRIVEIVRRCWLAAPRRATMREVHVSLQDLLDRAAPPRPRLALSPAGSAIESRSSSSSTSGASSGAPLSGALSPSPLAVRALASKSAHAPLSSEERLLGPLLGLASPPRPPLLLRVSAQSIEAPSPSPLDARPSPLSGARPPPLDARPPPLRGQVFAQDSRDYLRFSGDFLRARGYEHCAGHLWRTASAASGARASGARASGGALEAARDAVSGDAPFSKAAAGGAALSAESTPGSAATHLPPPLLPLSPPLLPRASTLAGEGEPAPLPSRSSMQRRERPQKRESDPRAPPFPSIASAHEADRAEARARSSSGGAAALSSSPSLSSSSLFGSSAAPSGPTGAAAVEDDALLSRPRSPCTPPLPPPPLFSPTALLLRSLSQALASPPALAPAASAAQADDEIAAFDSAAGAIDDEAAAGDADAAAGGSGSGLLASLLSATVSGACALLSLVVSGGGGEETREVEAEEGDVAVKCAAPCAEQPSGRRAAAAPACAMAPAPAPALEPSAPPPARARSAFAPTLSLASDSDGGGGGGAAAEPSPPLSRSESASPIARTPGSPHDPGEGGGSEAGASPPSAHGDGGDGRGAEERAGSGESGGGGASGGSPSSRVLTSAGLASWAGREVPLLVADGDAVSGDADGDEIEALLTGRAFESGQASGPAADDIPSGNGRWH